MNNFVNSCTSYGSSAFTIAQKAFNKASDTISECAAIVIKTTKAPLEHAIAAAVAAPILTTAASAVGAIAFTITPLQAFIFCGSIKLAERVTSSLTARARTLLIGKNNLSKDNESKVYLAIITALNVARITAVFFGIPAIAPSLAIPFSTLFVITAAANILNGAAVIAAHKAGLLK